jgi:hypothetical protein
MCPGLYGKVMCGVTGLQSPDATATDPFVLQSGVELLFTVV